VSVLASGREKKKQMQKKKTTKKRRKRKRESKVHAPAVEPRERKRQTSNTLLAEEC